MTDQEIIQLLGGVTAVARLLNIKPPSVHAWIEGGIPDGRLRELAAQIEIKSGGRFSRRERWPDNFAFYWPELAPTQSTAAQAATEAIENQGAPTAQPEALRTGIVRRHMTRRVKDVPIDEDRRHAGPPFQSTETGVA